MLLYFTDNSLHLLSMSVLPHRRVAFFMIFFLPRQQEGSNNPVALWSGGQEDHCGPRKQLCHKKRKKHIMKLLKWTFWPNRIDSGLSRVSPPGPVGAVVHLIILKGKIIDTQKKNPLLRTY